MGSVPVRCRDCSADRTVGRSWCASCERAKVAVRRRARRIKGLCFCGSAPAEGITTCSRCIDRNNVSRRMNNGIVRAAVFAAYGGSCSCCGEKRDEFLTMDHVIPFADGGGPRKYRGGIYLYRWLKRNGFPDGFRILCMNCNFARGQRGYCPHEVELGFAAFPLGGLTHVHVWADSGMGHLLDQVMEARKMTGQDINDFMRPVMEEFVRKAAIEVEARTKAPPEAELDTDTGF